MRPNREEPVSVPLWFQSIQFQNIQFGRMAASYKSFLPGW